MLQQLSGRTHEVLTAVALLPKGEAPRSLVDRSLVTFRMLEAGEAKPTGRQASRGIRLAPTGSRAVRASS